MTLQRLKPSLHFPTTPGGTRVNSSRETLRLVLHQTRYDLRSFKRDRRARFFTFFFPVILLVVFVGVFGNDTVHSGGQEVKTATLFLPGIIALSVVAASFVNLVVSITTQRELGVLKRRRATPVSAWVLITGRTLTSVIVSLAVMVLLVAIGWTAFSVQLPGLATLGLILTAIVGSVALSALGYALSTAITSIDAAQPMVQALVLPLYFISGVFVPSDSLPRWLNDVARVFPVEHLAAGLRYAFDPVTHGSGIKVSDLAILMLWGAAGLLIALRRFSWTPSSMEG